MTSAINSFKSKLQLVIKQLKRQDLKYFTFLKARNPQLNFERCFYDFNKLVNITTFISNPYFCKLIEEYATEIASQFNMGPSSFKNEVVQLISDITQSKYQNRLMNFRHHACEQHLVIMYHNTKSTLRACSVMY